MRQNGLYAELFTLQAAAYLDGAQPEAVSTGRGRDLNSPMALD